jgi:diguanylate cyclase (GGDEF)-like protein/PAS domain S-box-containing protein
MPTVAKLMTHHADRVAPSATIAEAARLMMGSRISSIIIIDDETVLGIVTERDILRAMLQGQDGSQAITSLMSSPVHTVSEEMDFRQAYRSAAVRGIRHLVVTDRQGKPLGVVTETDFHRRLGLEFFSQLNSVDTLMEHDFPRLPADATLDSALAAMAQMQQSCVVVIADEAPIGIVTERDVVRLFLGTEGSTTLGEVMTWPVASVQIDSAISDAAELMLERNFRHLAVVDRSNRLVGLLTEHCLVRPLKLEVLDDALANQIDLSKANAEVRKKIARSERYQRALLDNFPYLVWLKDTESRFLTVNRHMAQAVGESSVSAMLGKTDADYYPPEFAKHYRADDSAVMASGEKKYVIEEIITNGARVWHETYKAPIIDANGAILGTVGFARNISARKRSEEAVVMRNAALAGLLRGERLEGLLELIAISAETELPGLVCSILLVSEDGRHLRLGAAPGLPEASQKVIDGMPIEEGSGASGTAAFRKTRVVIEDIFTDPKGEKFREFARAIGASSGWAEPMFSPNGELLGTFAAYHRNTRLPHPEEQELLRLASQLAALVISQHRQAEQLAASLSTFRGIFDSVDEALFIINRDGILLDQNARAEQLSGFERNALLGQRYQRLLVEGMNVDVKMGERFTAALLGSPAVVEIWTQSACGRIFPAEVRMRPGKYFGQDVVIASVQDICERRSAAERMAVERDLAEALANGKSRDELLPVLLDIALRFPEFDCGGIYLRQPDGGYQLVEHRKLSENFLAGVRFFPAESSRAQIISAGEIICSCHEVTTACAQPELIHSPHMVAEGIRCLAILPIVANGQSIACINLAGRHTSQISHGTFNALHSLGKHFALTLMRVDAQTEARQSQQNIAGLFDRLRDFLFIVSPDGTILHYNQAVSELLGYPPGALIGQPIATVHPPEMQKMVAEIMGEMLTGQRISCALPILRADGSPLAVETRVVQGFWSGQPAILGISQDISERLLAEERQKLAASVFDHAHEGIMITDPRGRIIEVNDTFSELTGYSRAETIGQTTELLKSGHHTPEFYLDMWQAIQKAGYWQGEVWNRKKSGQIFVEQLTISTVRDRQGEVSHFVGIFTDITLIKEHQQRLEHLAHFDALTQLPNRMLLSERMQLAMAQTARSGQTLAVCYLDLDGFKPVNDLYGHSAGDRLLVDVAQRLKACLRGGDTVSRLGGDEFVLLFSGLENVHECDLAIARIIATLTRPFKIDEYSIDISASIGVTLYPQDGADADTLLRHADQAMYAAKQAGRNRYHLFDPENDRRARLHRDELEQISEALAKGEFALYYQPKVDMRLGIVIGAEALIRWHHPTRGLLLPGEFLHVVDGSELAIELGDWVIREALRQLDAWVGEGLDFSVSINIAGDHLQHPGFAQRLGELLAAHPRVPPGRLELEILETAVLEDIGLVAQLFAECRKLGVSFALDDFGTGYSSLTYFRRLPADVLKIDQSFVRDMLEDPEDLAIVEGVIGLTQAFKRKVIAEGVETVEHGLALLLLGCDHAQGYGIARPMPAESLPAWIQNFRCDDLWSLATSFNWSRDDLPMMIAEADHKRWVLAINKFIDTPNGTAPKPELNHHKCRFGLWYYGTGSQRYASLDGFRNVEEAHRKLHEIGIELIERHQASEAQAGHTQAIEHLKIDLDRASGTLTDYIQLIQAEILISAQTAKR